jgi:hypothetical protein
MVSVELNVLPSGRDRRQIQRLQRAVAVAIQRRVAGELPLSWYEGLRVGSNRPDGSQTRVDRGRHVTAQ